MGQSHFTLGFPLKPPSDVQGVANSLNAVVPLLAKSADELGTIHYARFTVLSGKTLLLLADFDGDFAVTMAGLGKLAGPVFDTAFGFTDAPPPTPVAANVDAFVEWAAKHLIHPVNVYTAYPDVTVKQIKTLAAAAGVIGEGELNPFLVILPTRSHLAFIELQLILRAKSRGITKDLDTVGTPHFAQFVPLEDNQIGFFTVYDGSFDKYIGDFTKNIGPIFDIIFKFTKDPPPSPCRKHLQEFINFAAGANRTPIGFYQAYPGLSVQDIHALVADSQAHAA
jgi:hypothetical protein